MLAFETGRFLLLRPVNSGNSQSTVIPAEAGIQSVVTLINAGLDPRLSMETHSGRGDIEFDIQLPDQ